MTPYSRRSVLQSVAVLAVTGLAGCASEAPGGSEVYYVYGHVVNDTPGGATVIDASDDRIDDVQVIQRAVTEAEPKEGAALQVSESTYKHVEGTLKRTPLYRNGPDTYANRTGLYVNASGKTVRVSIFESKLV